MLERLGENRGAFVLDGVGDFVCGCFEAGGDGAGPCDEPGDVTHGRASFFQQFKRLVEIFRGLSGVADDQIGAERELAEAFRESVGEGCVVACGVPAVHRLENLFATALDGNMDKLVEALVCETVEQSFLITEDVAWVAHAEANAVIPVHVRQYSLREFGEIRADVKAVAGAVLAGELDLEASVIDESLDLIDNRAWSKTVEAAFDQVRAAEGAGIKASFFDVHDADVGRFAKDVLVAGNVLIAFFFASTVLFRVTQIKTQ